MKNIFVILAAIGLCASSFMRVLWADELVWEDIGKSNGAMNAVLVDPENPRIIYAGSNNAVLKSEDGGSSWELALSVRGENTAVNFIIRDTRDINMLYAATGNGLYCSDSAGKYWRRVFSGKNLLENDCTVLIAVRGQIFLGTKSGLFISHDSGRSWHRQEGQLGKCRIYAITCDNKNAGCVYVLCETGLFKGELDSQEWRRIFVCTAAENDKEQNEYMENQKEEESEGLRYVCVDPENPGYLYLSGRGGIRLSKDTGTSWEHFNDYGLIDTDVKFLLMPGEGRLFGVTRSGIFEYTNQRWQEISLRLPAGEIRCISMDSTGNIYAASYKGLFKARPIRYNVAMNDYISVYLKDEPEIGKLQEAAIAYAEVEPEKIKRWRAQAAKKALLPQVSVGIDRNTSDLWHWESGSTTKFDDDVLRRGRDTVEWDVTVSWDLSEIIWNNDQTSIDSRSKLMAELRDNILDQVTRMYFERLRVKMELDSLPIEDRKKRLERSLRLRELSASLDALTGGYYSKYRDRL
ncbi:MAG: hypothetical protein ACM3IL_05520 [Deltaproteobacteria bacterium]